MGKIRDIVSGGNELLLSLSGRFLAATFCAIHSGAVVVAVLFLQGVPGAFAIIVEVIATGCFLFITCFWSPVTVDVNPSHRLQIYLGVFGSRSFTLAMASLCLNHIAGTTWTYQETPEQDLDQSVCELYSIFGCMNRVPNALVYAYLVVGPLELIAQHFVKWVFALPRLRYRPVWGFHLAILCAHVCLFCAALLTGDTVSLMIISLLFAHLAYLPVLSPWWFHRVSGGQHSFVIITAITTIVLVGMAFSAGPQRMNAYLWLGLTITEYIACLGATFISSWTSEVTMGARKNGNIERSLELEARGASPCGSTLEPMANA